MADPKPALLEQITTKKAQPFQLDLLPKKPTAVQLRADGLNTETVTRYADAYRDGAELPPIVVFEDRTQDAGGDDVTYHLADGHHRVAAARKAELVEINALVKKGTRRDAVLYAAGANGAHGLPLTNEDKRRIVTTVLADDEWATWSDNEIARRCHVSPRFVAKMRPAAGAKTSERIDKNGVKRSVPGKKAKIEASEPTSAPPAPAIGPGEIDKLASELQRRGAIPSIANATKARIMAALFLAHRGFIGQQGALDRETLTALVGILDVHPGQLSRDNRILQDQHYNTYRLPDEDYSLQAEEFLENALPCLTVLGIGPGFPQAAPATEPETLDASALTGTTTPVVDATKTTTPVVDGGPAPQRPQPGKRTTLADRRQAWIRHQLADRIEAAHTFRGDAREQAALIVITGIDNDHAATWGEAFVQGAHQVLIAALAGNVAHDLREGQAHRLPTWDTLARLFGIEYDAIRILADRTITE